MILPIISAISREVFLQAPALHREAAWPSAPPRWEMIRMAVLPYGRSGIIAGAMLGLGRALGETIAVAIVLSAASGINCQPDPSTRRHDRVEHRAAVRRGRPASAVNALIASGLVLFVITLAVNMIARLDRQPARRLLRSELMSTDTQASAADLPRRRDPSARSAGCSRSALSGSRPRLAVARSRCCLVASDRLRLTSACSSSSSCSARWSSLYVAARGSRAAGRRRPPADVPRLRARSWSRWSRWFAGLDTVLARAWRGSTATSSPLDERRRRARAAAPTTRSSAR